MPIEPDKLLGAPLHAGSARWEPDDVILYHLGVGAGNPPTDDNELSYTYEARLKVLPSFAVIPVFGAIAGVIMLDGIRVNPMMILHGEQAVTLHAPLPTAGKITNSGSVTGVYDKGEGKGAVVVAEIHSADESGAPLFTNRFSLFARGEGGFGGDGGPAPGNEPPVREPDLVVESPTLPQQAALYRLSGDRNPLHIDPMMSKLGGYDTPILHGLCSYGIVCKAVVDHALGGDVTKVGRYEARFGGVVFPGETIVTSMWHERDRVVVAAVCKERESPVIKNAAITLRGG
jgi:acyl dehydratase